MAANNPTTAVNLAIAQEVDNPNARIKTLEQDFSLFEIEFGETTNTGVVPPTTNVIQAEGAKDANNLYWEMQDVIIPSLPVNQWYGFRFRAKDTEGNVGDWSSWEYNQVGDITAPGAPASPTFEYAQGKFKVSFSYNFDAAGNEDCARFEFAIFEDHNNPGSITSANINDGTNVPDDIMHKLKQASWTGTKTIELLFNVKQGVAYTVYCRAIDFSDNASDWADMGDLTAPYPDAAIDENTTALIPFSNGVGSTDGLFPSNDPQVVLRNDGRYGGCVEISEIPSDVLDWTSQPNLIKDSQMDGGLDEWKGWCVEFDGVDDYVEVTDDDNLSFVSSDFSILSRFRLYSLSDYCVIVSKYDTNPKREYYLRVNPNGSVLATLSKNDATADVSYVTPAGTIEVGQDYSVAFVYDFSLLNSNGGQIYVNGIPVTTTETNAAGFTDMSNTAGRVRIGNLADGDKWYFDGEISDIKIFNMALTASNIEYYSKGNPVKPEHQGASQTELVTNGGFDTDTDWTKEPGWTIGSGVATCDGTLSSKIYQVSFFTKGKVYDITFEISSYTSGSLLLRDGGLTFGSTYNAVGTYTVLGYTSTSGGYLGFFSNNFVGSIDNVSVTQIGAVADYPMNEGNGNYIIDRSGNGNIGQIYGATWKRLAYSKSSNKAWRGKQSLQLPPARVQYEVDVPYRVVGSELVANGGFDANTTSWTAVNCTLASVAGGQSGNCLELTRTSGTDQSAYSTGLSLSLGRQYRVSVWVKSGSSGDETFAIFTTAATGGTIRYYTGVSTKTWEKHEFVFTLPLTGYTGTYRLYLRKISSTPGTMLFDTVSIVEVEYQSSFLYSQMAYLPTKGAAVLADSMALDNTANWSKIDCTLTFDTDHYEIVYSAATQHVYRTITVTEGKYYRAVIWHKDGTASGISITLFVADDTSGTNIVATKNTTTKAVWQKLEIVFRAGAGTDTIDISTSLTSGNIEIKDFSIYEISMLDVGVEGYHVLSGSANTNTANHLIDTVQYQFGDVTAGDWVHNLDDDTWAQVTAATSSDLTLNWDAFPNGDESYEVFVNNKSSRYVGHFTHDGADEWSNKSMQLVPGQYDNRLIFTYTKNIHDQNYESYLDYLHLIRENDDGLVGHWKLSRRDGARDLSGNGHDGTINGNPTYVDDSRGVLDGALHFDGTGDFINCGQVLPTNQALPISFAAWVKIDNSGMSAWRTFVGTLTSAAQIGMSNGNVVCFGQNGGGWLVFGSTLSSNTWYFVVGVYNGINASLYLDGALDAGPTANSFAAAHGVSLIGSYNDTGAEPMYGVIDDVRIYNRALSASEIKALYDSTKHLYTSNSVNFLKQGGVPVRINNDFDINNRGIVYPAKDVLNLGMTITLDFRLLDYNGTNDGYIIHHYSSPDTRLYLYHTNQDGTLMAQIGSASATNLNTNLILNRQYKLALIFDDVNSKWYCIINGTVVANGITLTGWNKIADSFGLGNLTTSGGSRFSNIIIENFRVDKVARTVEQVRAFHELQVPFFDPDPTTSPPLVLSFDNSKNIYPVSTKEELVPNGTVKITNGSSTVTGFGTKFTRMFKAGEKIEIEGTSSGTVVYTVSSITNDTTLVLTANVAEKTAAGLSYHNGDLKGIAEIAESLKDLKKVKKYD